MLLTTAAPFLQAIKTYTSHSTADLSLGMWIAQTVGGVIWITYGLATKQGPVILANALTGLAAGAVLIAFLVFHS